MRTPPYAASSSRFRYTLRLFLTPSPSPMRALFSLPSTTTPVRAFWLPLCVKAATTSSSSSSSTSRPSGGSLRLSRTTSSPTRPRTLLSALSSMCVLNHNQSHHFLSLTRRSQPRCIMALSSTIRRSQTPRRRCR